MISETRFATNFGSLWKGLAPTMELFVRKCNLSLYDRNWHPLESNVQPDRRGAVNQTAFELFCAAFASALPAPGALHFFKLPENQQEAQRAANLPEDEDELSPGELAEVSELAMRMWYRFSVPAREDVTLRPLFRGCGIINNCTGDVLTGSSHLIEFKDGDRAFRSYEFRQLSVYAALFMNSTGELPSSIEVLNSRRGVGTRISMSGFADEVSGRSSYDYLREIIRVISDVGPSQ